MATPNHTVEELRSRTFLVVADIGNTADYSTEPRHIIELMLPYDDMATVTPGQAGVVEQSLRARTIGLPHEEFPLHVWHLDSSGEPGMCLSEMARPEPTDSNALKAMVTCPQSMHRVQVLLQIDATVAAPFACQGQFIAADHWNTINEIIDSRFPGLCYIDYSGHDYEEGQLNVEVSGWASAMCLLPFTPSTRLSHTQIRFAIAAACKVAGQGRPWHTHEDWVQAAWGVVKNKPAVNLCGLVDVKTGYTTMRSYQGQCRALKRAIPNRLLPPPTYLIHENARRP